MANKKLDGALEDLEMAHQHTRGFLEVILDSSARQLATIPCCEATISESRLPEDGLHGWLSVTEVLSRALASVGLADEYLADVRERLVPSEGVRSRMEHLNDSFLGAEEAIINAIRLLGVHAMGIDPDGTRREALDELAVALECLKTGTESVRRDGPDSPDFDMSDNEPIPYRLSDNVEAAE